MLLAFFKCCEASGVGKGISGSVYLFPVVEAVHLLGLAVIGGAVLIVDLRLPPPRPRGPARARGGGRRGFDRRLAPRRPRPAAPAGVAGGEGCRAVADREPPGDARLRLPADGVGGDAVLLQRGGV